MKSDEILKLHRDHAWQPFTQMFHAKDPVVIEGARGSVLLTPEGREILDGVGSWWTVIHGHNHPALRRALFEQFEKLDHVMYSGFTHEAAARLSKALSDSTGGALPRVFFSDNGSTAVEIALKMAFQFYANRGEAKRTRFIALERGYHGDTIGTMSVGARSFFHKMYEPLLYETVLVESPSVPFVDFDDPVKSAHHLESAFASLEVTMERHQDELCGMILEPLIQGAGGMNIYPPLYLKRTRELCDRYGIFLIADEVFTGVGRTGTMYACEQAGIWPDMMALSKGLTSGALPFAATLASEKLFQGFYSEDRMKTLFHGHSMTAHAPGCAVALASLELFRSEDRMADVKRLELGHKKHSAPLMRGAAGKLFREVRYLGSVAAFELDLEDAYISEFGWRVRDLALDRGGLIRPLGNVFYMTPPYTMSNEELERLYSILEESLVQAQGLFP